MADSSSGQESCSSSSFDLGKLRTELECCICLSLFEDPRQLQCGHICCAACLQSLIDMANEPGDVGILFGGKSLHKSITCPQCNEENRVPLDGKFPKAFIVTNLVSHVKQAETESEKAEKLAAKQKCSSCDKSVPYQELFYCLDCHEFDKENGTTGDDEALNTFLMTKLICPLCTCKFHGVHKKAAANEAKEAVVEKKKRILQADPDPDTNAQQKLTGLQAKASDETVLDPIKLAKAEELRLKGNEAYGFRIYEEAIKFYTLSIRQYAASSTCLSNRAQANINLGRFSVAYVDANEALRLDPNNEKAKWRRDKALESMGMARGKIGPKLGQNANCENIEVNRGKNQFWPNDLHISAIFLLNEDYIDESMAEFVPQNVVCMETVGESVEEAVAKNRPVPLRQLDLYLNDGHVQGPIAQVSFKFVKFDEQMVQMFRRIKPERFQRVDTGGVHHPGNSWVNCDFSQLSEASFRFLFDSHLFGCINSICIAEWTGMPAGYTYNSLFKLRAFRDAMDVTFDIGARNGPDSPDFNLHLDTKVLIDFLHSQGFRSLKLNDGQLHEGFDAFRDRLIERFQQDRKSRFYELDILVLNATAKTKLGLELDKPQFMANSKTRDTLVLGWHKPDVRIPIRGTYNTDDLFEFQARRYRSEEDVHAIRLYHSKPHGGMVVREA